MAEEPLNQDKSEGRGRPRKRAGGASIRPGLRDAAKQGSAGARRALVVAINEYDVFNRLPSCIADGEAIAAVLEREYDFDVTKLYDAEATLEGVRAALAALFADATPDDRLVFFFSGHGTTVPSDGVLEECLVLVGKDEFLFDDELVHAARDVPPGVLTLVIDSCFSGGMEKTLVATVTDGARVKYRPRNKAFTRTSAEAFEAHNSDQMKAKVVKRFVEPQIEIAAGLSLFDFSPALGFAASPMAKDLTPAPPSDEERQAQLKGVLLSACLETETASASTPETDGMSAFTFALVRAIRRLGVGASAAALVEACQTDLKAHGFRQTPLIKASPESAADQTFITFAASKPANVAAGVIDPRLNDVLQQIFMGGNDMNPLLMALLMGGMQKGGGAPQKDAATIAAVVAAINAIGGLIKGDQKSLPGFPFPGINPLILLAAASGQGGQKGVTDLLPLILPLLKGDQADSGQKGILDALPVILPLILKGGQPSADKGFGELVPLILPLLKGGGGGGEEKLDPATITAGAALITAIGGLFR